MTCDTKMAFDEDEDKGLLFVADHHLCSLLLQSASHSREKKWKRYSTFNVLSMRCSPLSDHHHDHGAQLNFNYQGGEREGKWTILDPALVQLLSTALNRLRMLFKMFLMILNTIKCCTGYLFKSWSGYFWKCCEKGAVHNNSIQHCQKRRPL